MNRFKSIIAGLSEIVGPSGVLTESTDLVAYSYDGTSNWHATPDVVVLPTTTEQVAAVMQLAYDQEIPVTVRGAGTNLSGGSIPVEGGIVLCMTRMDRILDIDAANFTATVEVGVVLNKFNQALARQNLFFPPDPQSFLAATIGGCAAENSGGPYAVKYGIFKHYLLGMQIVLPGGRILNLGGKTVKNVTGYDLTLLLCGSEGTLAVITSVTLRLLPRPETRQTILAIFDEVTTAGGAVHRIRQSGLIPAKIEMIDNWIIRRIEEMSPLGLPRAAEAILLFELDGNSAAVENESREVIRLCREADAVDVRPAKDAEEAENFWAARRAGFSAIWGNSPTVLAEDVTVPTDRMAELISTIQTISRRHDVPVVMIGHAGDGNLHPCILTDKKNAEHFHRAEQVASEIFSTALALGGVISGEHGIGLEKKKFLKLAMEPGAIELLKSIKQVFDPKGLLNPGKIWEAGP
ncbi:MAG: FAD-binding protein [Deltaproteobacteria bacterium]|nr:FAD-binding protein [Deltaproteobacteria bacterium]